MRISTSRTNGVLRMAALLLCATVGCRTGTGGPGREFVSGEVGARMNVPLGIGHPGLPPDVVSDDGLTEDEAVAVAMWNNALLQETLTELGVSRARLYDAGLLTDPQFTTFFPLGPKQFEMTLFQSVDAVWLRQIRVRAACLDLNSVAQRMVQNGLDTIRDTRQAHADLLFAQERSALANEASQLRTEIRDLAEKRLAAGDIGELEVMTIRVEALRAEADARRFARDVEVARHRLVQLLGIRDGSEPFAVPGDSELPSATDRETLVAEAMAMRPDLRAAEIDVEAACQRCDLARNQFMTLDGVVDANSRGRKGFEAGPGLRFSLPVFNGNRGGRAIAAASYEQAVSRTVTIRDQIAVEVRTAHTAVERADENLRAVREEILPALAEAEELARENYAAGGAPYFLVLQTTSQFLDARARELELEVELRRAVADLERGVGRRLREPVLPPDLPSPDGPVLLPADEQATPAVPVPEAPQPIPAIEQTGATAPLANAGSTVVRSGDAVPPVRADAAEPSMAPRSTWSPPSGPVRYPLRRDHSAPRVFSRDEIRQIWGREGESGEGRGTPE